MKKDNIKAMCLTANGIDIWTEDGLVKSTVMSESAVRMILFGRSLKMLNEGGYVKCYAPEMIRMLNVGRNIRDIIKERK